MRYKVFTHYEEQPDGQIIAFFEDGTQAVGHLLVGADGVNSRVRKQFLPQAERIETGVIDILGKVPLTDETRALLALKRADISLYSKAKRSLREERFCMHRGMRA